MADIHVPETCRERLKKFMERKEEKVIESEEHIKIKKDVKIQPIMPHPDDPFWYNKENANDYMKLFYSAPYDARFPQQKRQRQCFYYYVDYFRCQELLGKDYKPCKFFWNVYNDICPKFWLTKWDEMREEGKFPYKFDR